MNSDVFVIGAGPAGLTAAYLLTQEAVPTTVIEMDERYVGGISRTENYKGYLFDIGGHRFFSKSKEVVDLWNEILPDDFIERPRLSRIFYKDKFYAYPLKALEALKNLGVFETYTEKVWGMSCDEISADWAAQRIKGLTLGTAVIDGLRRSLGRKSKNTA